MSLPDNRIRLPSVKIDFDADVGTTGQDHDTYPAPQSQARFDHMRMFLIGLLAQQSSFTEPSQKRDGTPWYDLNNGTLKIYVNNEWVSYSSVIGLTTDSPPLTLASWYASVSESLSSLAPELIFGGKSENITSEIPIPESIRALIYTDSRAFVTINGLSLDPRTASFIGSPAPTLIRLSKHELEPNDEFYVSIRRVPISTYVIQDVVS